MRSTSWKQVDERVQAIETLYRERYGRFRDGVATITGDYETARDVVQEAFARALRKRRDVSRRGLTRGLGLADRAPDGPGAHEAHDGSDAEWLVRGGPCRARPRPGAGRGGARATA